MDIGQCVGYIKYCTEYLIKKIIAKGIIISTSIYLMQYDIVAV